MLTLLLKRQARAKKELEKQSEPIQSEIVSIEGAIKQRLALEDKPWP